MAELVETYRELIADVYELAGRSRATADSYARHHGQSVARWHVLSVLLDGAHTVPQIAQRLGLRRQSVQRVVDELHFDGLVEFEHNPQHQRSRMITVSKQGAQTAMQLYLESAAARQRILDVAGVTADQLASARAVLQRLNHALARPDADIFP